MAVGEGLTVVMESGMKIGADNSDGAMEGVDFSFSCLLFYFIF